MKLDLWPDLNELELKYSFCTQTRGNNICCWLLFHHKPETSTLTWNSNNYQEITCVRCNPWEFSAWSSVATLRLTCLAQFNIMMMVTSTISVQPAFGRCKIVYSNWSRRVNSNGPPEWANRVRPNVCQFIGLEHDDLLVFKIELNRSRRPGVIVIMLELFLCSQATLSTYPFVKKEVNQLSDIRFSNIFQSLLITIQWFLFVIKYLLSQFISTRVIWSLSIYLAMQLPQHLKRSL